MSSEIEYLKQLKEQMIIFLDELIEFLPEEPELVIIRIFVKDKIPIVHIMNYITEKLIPLKQYVINKDDSFFINNNILFEKVDPKKVNHFKNLLTSGKLTVDDKETIWKWFRTFIYIAEKYTLSKK